jgi:predicted RNA-binding protein (virulence factor B family)
MMHLGQYNTLTILRFTAPGAYLGDDEDNVVLLPTKYIPEGAEIGDEISVFLYLDSEDRIIATTLKPLLELHSFGILKVNEVSHFGAFLEWGIEKDLLVPFKEQNQKMEEGKSYIVYLYLDEATHRLVASSRIKRYLESERILVQENDEVDLLICNTTELGKNVIVNDTYSGLIYKNEIVRPLRYGERCKGYVKKVREDGKLDISLEKIGFVKMEDTCQRILNYLSEHDGKMFLTDKSDPDVIREEIGMSKKTFKSAVGMLYKQKLIVINEDHIGIGDF